MKLQAFTASDDFYNRKQPTANSVLVEEDERGHCTWEVEVNTIEDIMAIIKETGHRVIIDDWSLTVYDYHVE